MSYKVFFIKVSSIKCGAFILKKKNIVWSSLYRLNWSFTLLNYALTHIVLHKNGVYCLLRIAYFVYYMK